MIKLLRRWMPGMIAAGLVLATGLALTAHISAQQGDPGTGNRPPFPSAGNSVDPANGQDSRDESLLRMEKRQEKLRNEQRQQQLVKDTNTLLELATQLKEEVGKTDKNVLSIDVVKKATEIEKLAKSVREKMKAD